MIFESEFASFSPKWTILTKLLANFEKKKNPKSPWIWNWKMFFMKKYFRNRAILDMKRSESENFAYQKFRSMPTYAKSQAEFSILAFQRSVIDIFVIFVIFCYIFVIFYARKFYLFHWKILKTPEFNLLIPKNGRNKGILVWKSWTWYFTTGWLFVWPYVFVS